MKTVLEVAPKLGVSATCAAFRVSRATYYRERAPMHGPKRRRPSPPRRLSTDERAPRLAHGQRLSHFSAQWRSIPLPLSETIIADDWLVH
jgi:hypothetical protein